MGNPTARLMYVRHLPFDDKGLCVFYSDSRKEISDLKNVHYSSNIIDAIPNHIADILPFPIKELVEKFMGRDPEEMRRKELGQ